MVSTSHLIMYTLGFKSICSDLENNLEKCFELSVHKAGAYMAYGPLKLYFAKHKKVTEKILPCQPKIY